MRPDIRRVHPEISGIRQTAEDPDPAFIAAPSVKRDEAADQSVGCGQFPDEHRSDAKSGGRNPALSVVGNQRQRNERTRPHFRHADGKRNKSGPDRTELRRRSKNEHGLRFLMERQRRQYQRRQHENNEESSGHRDRKPGDHDWMNGRPPVEDARCWIVPIAKLFASRNVVAVAVANPLDRRQVQHRSPAPRDGVRLGDGEEKGERPRKMTSTRPLRTSRADVADIRLPTMLARPATRRHLSSHSATDPRRADVQTCGSMCSRDHRRRPAGLVRRSHADREAVGVLRVQICAERPHFRAEPTCARCRVSSKTYG